MNLEEQKTLALKHDELLQAARACFFETMKGVRRLKVPAEAHNHQGRWLDVTDEGVLTIPIATIVTDQVQPLVSDLLLAIQTKQGNASFELDVMQGYRRGRLNFESISRPCKWPSGILYELEVYFDLHVQGTVAYKSHSLDDDTVYQQRIIQVDQMQQADNFEAVLSELQTLGHRCDMVVYAGPSQLTTTRYRFPDTSEVRNLIKRLAK